LVDKSLFTIKHLTVHHTTFSRGRRGRDRMVVGIYNYLCNQCLSGYHHWCKFESQPVRIQQYVIKFINDLRQFGGFLQVLHHRHDITEILLKVALNTITQKSNIVKKKNAENIWLW